MYDSIQLQMDLMRLDLLGLDLSEENSMSNNYRLIDEMATDELQTCKLNAICSMDVLRPLAQPLQPGSLYAVSWESNGDMESEVQMIAAPNPMRAIALAILQRKEVFQTVFVENGTGVVATAKGIE